MTFKIGITGGIGSGKSVVCDLLRNMGYPVFDTDREAKWLMANSAELREKLIDAFGENTFQDGELNRSYLASVIFGNREALLKMNAIVHPAVREYFCKWSTTHRCDIVFFESAILFESDFFRVADQTWVVTAPDQLRLLRTVKRDNTTPGQVESRMKSQLPQEEKRKRADVEIINDDKHPLIPQVLSALKRVKEHSRYCNPG